MQEANTDSKESGGATGGNRQGNESVVLEAAGSGIYLLRLGSAEERVVTLTFARMESFRAALEELKNNKAKALIITGSHTEMFAAGADINLIKKISDPEEGQKLATIGQQIFNDLEALPFPTIAAISGPCVGGACELALACTHRIMSDSKSSAIGLPEIRLGILPGFGGTQRLPRLLGLKKSLDIILGGKILKPKEAFACGLVNKVCPADKLLETAQECALGSLKLKSRKLSLLDRLLMNSSFGRKLVRKKTVEFINRKSKGFYPAPPAALDCVMFGLEKGMEEGLKNEARELGRLIVTPECKSLVNLFFLTEASKGIGKSARKSTDHVHAVVIGAGAMGAGIAGVLAKNECSVILKDSTEEGLARGMKHIKKYFSKIRSLDEAEKSFMLNRIEATSRDSSNTGNANFVIEAIFEDLDLKKRVLKEISNQVPEDAIIASNTSSLSISEIAKTIDHPERVIGMHFFNPVEKMPLVEIVRGKETGDKSIATVAALANKLNKFPIVVNDVPGFLINRILTPYLNEAAFLLQDGCTLEDIDKAALDFGMPMGPLRLLDEIGLDVAGHVSDVMINGYGERMKGPGFTRKLVAAGRLGKKSGGGFYDFDDGTESPHADITELLEIEVDREKVPPGDDIVNRLIMSLLNEAVKCLDEGVAGQPGKDAANQIDLGTVMGMGFPPFKGGLLHYAETQGVKDIFKKLDELQKKYGNRFKPAEGITLRAVDDKSFYQA